MIDGHRDKWYADPSMNMIGAIFKKFLSFAQPNPIVIGLPKSFAKEKFKSCYKFLKDHERCLILTNERWSKLFDRLLIDH